MYCKSHNWEPLSQWGARYRCKKCGCFGYRANAVMRGEDFLSNKEIVFNKSSSIVPYVCATSGCQNPGCAKDHKGVWCCWEHRREAPKKPVEVFCPKCQTPSGSLCRNRNGIPQRTFHPERTFYGRHWWEYDLEIVLPVWDEV